LRVSIVTVSQVFKTYQGQARIAELNSKNPVKRTQGQRDQVSISTEAKAALTKHAMEHLLAQLRSSQAAKAEEVPSENLKAEIVQSDNIETKKNEATLSAVTAE
jgi:hypothetical protein